MIKKKKQESYTKYFKMPHLFREDLEMIQEIVWSELKPQKYKIEFGDYECGDIDEIDKDMERTFDFHIITFSPYISVSLGPNGARIYTSDEDLKTIGAVTKIAEVISRTERRFRWILSKSATFLAPFIGYAGLQIAASLNQKNPIVARVSLIVFGICCIWWYVGIRSDLYNSSIVEFVFRKAKLNFFARNKDQIGIAILSAIFGAGAALLFQKLF